MHKIFTLIKREYRESVFKKSFIIMTVLTPLIMVGMGVIPSLLVSMDVEEPSVISVLDESGFIQQKLQNSLNDTLQGGAPRYVLNILTPQNTEESIEKQKRLINDKTIDGFLHIPADIMETGKIAYYSKNVANFNINKRLRDAINSIVIDKRLQESNLDHDLVNKLTRWVDFQTIKITKSGEESERGFMEEFFSTFIFTLILYVTLIMYGMVLMRSITEEKTSRIIEVLLSSTNHFQILAGKLFGQGAVGLTQYLIWAVFGIVLVLFGSKMMPVSADAFQFSPAILMYFVLFFTLGFFLFSTMYIGVGAVTNTDQEAQQMAMPITMMLVVPIILISFLVKNPDSQVVQIMSYIPFFSPIIMFGRINLGSPGAGEIILSISILIATIILMIWIISKVFKIGILMHGKRPTLPEIVRWLKQ
jgi:ABC-2 type transport system permease protein